MRDPSRTKQELIEENSTLKQRIQELERSKDALRDVQTRYRLLFEHAPDGIMIVDPATARFVEFNEAAHRQLGYSPEEFANLSIPDIETVESPVEVSRRIEKVMHQGRDDFETKLRTRQGNIRNIQVTAQMTEISGKAVYHCVWRDITEYKKATEALKESEEILKAIINGSPVPQFVVDGNHRVAHWNKAMEKLTGVGGKEMIGTDRHLRLAYNEERTCLADLVMDDKTEEIFRAYPGKSRRSNLIEGAYEVTDLVCIPGKEEEKWVHFTAAQIRDSKGSVIGAVETLEDITELARAIEALKKREQDLEIQSVNLTEAYTALKVLLQHKEEDKETLEKMFLANVRELVLPYIDKLESTRPSGTQKAYIDIVKSNLNDIISPFLQKMSVIDYRLTPAELQVAIFIKEGKSSKEVAQALNIGMGTVETHRKSIRHKLGLSKIKVNLQSYLRSLK
jgi:PAS domain S-box-containing protein